MKNKLFKLIFLCTVTIIIIAICVACNKSLPQDEQLEDEKKEIMLPEFISTPDINYACQDDSKLATYKDKSIADYIEVCDYYKASGYEVYGESEKNGSLFATLVNGSKMAHVYFLADRGELNVVTSDKAGDTLPPKTPDVVDGEYEVTITQMQDATHVNGMCYIIQLADGSYIVYDGAYTNQSQKIMQHFKRTAPDENNIVIRAWILTHSHEDHYPAFGDFAKKYASKATVEYVIIAPIERELAATMHGGDTYFNDNIAADIAKFDGAKTVYAHTGMEFKFCNLNLEILLSPDDLFKEENHGGNFNNTSIVSRVYDDEYSFFAAADTAFAGCEWLMSVYGEYLKSDICQVAHHGVEDAPISFYDLIKAPILYYPCLQWLYDANSRNNEVRDALEKREYTKEILIAELARFTRAWGTKFAEDAPLSMPNYIPPVDDGDDTLDF